MKILALSSFDNNAECVDYLLANPDKQLVDFLHSKDNGNTQNNENFIAQVG